MALERSVRPLARCVQATRHDRLLRAFSSSTVSRADVETADTSAPNPPPPPPPASSEQHALDPETVHSPKYEHRLQRRQHASPVGSRRRRAALYHLRSQNIETLPFEQMPYQCFQEARKFLQEDRTEKLQQIKLQREAMERLKTSKVEVMDEVVREKKLADMERRMGDLKVWADINDPVVKKNFEDGLGDMSKPIYRYLTDRDWRSYKRKILMQRIEQMNVVPDVIPSIDPTVSTELSFGRRKVQHGEFVDSRVSEVAPNLKLQCYDKGERLVTIAVVNPDVPDVESDGFSYRGHFLACNVKLSPTEGHVRLGNLNAQDQVLLDWLPAYAQKGAPYQRMSVFVLEQPNGPIDVAKIKETGKITERRKLKRDGFILRRMLEFFGLKPVGVDLFRTQWDEGTAGVMERAGIIGWDVEFKRKRVEPLPYKKLPGSKYR